MSKWERTVKGAVWLDKDKTPPYELYQYLRNVADADVIKCLKLLTFVPIEEIREMEQWKDGRINEAKVRLAYEVTKIVHGQKEADQAKEVSESLFGGAGASENMATTSVPASALTDGARFRHRPDASRKADSIKGRGTEADPAGRCPCK